jgi:hypothetical protein
MFDRCARAKSRCKARLPGMSTELIAGLRCYRVAITHNVTVGRKATMFRKAVRKIVLGVVSVLALGIGGFVLDYATDAGNPVSSAASESYAAESSRADADRQSEDARWAEQQLRKDNIRWAQVELRTRGLYRGSLDGVLGPRTKQALRRFQRDNGLSRTASLDARTWEALTDEASIGVGSSTPPDAPKAGATTDTPPASHLGK